MAFLDFNEDQYIKMLDTGESLRLGSFQTQDDGELFAIRSLIYINDVSQMTGNEEFRLGIYSDSECSLLMFSSDYSRIENIALHDETYGTKKGWYGFVATYFNRENISSQHTYYLKAETNNYTRLGDRYIGFGYSYPFPVYGSIGPKFTSSPIAFQIYMYMDSV